MVPLLQQFVSVACAEPLYWLFGFEGLRKSFGKGRLLTSLKTFTK